MSTDPTAAHAAEVSEHGRSGWRLLWIPALVLLIAIVGVALWLVLSGGEEPTISFDGTAATYSGPSTFETETITFRLENTSDERVTFGWNVVNDDSITLEDEIIWMETHRGPTYEIPPWVENYGGIGQTVGPGVVTEGSVDRPDGKGLLWVWDPSNRILYPAAHITVNSG